MPIKQIKDSTKTSISNESQVDRGNFKIYLIAGIGALVLGLCFFFLLASFFVFSIRMGQSRWQQDSKGQVAATGAEKASPQRETENRRSAPQIISPEASGVAELSSAPNRLLPASPDNIAAGSEPETSNAASEINGTEAGPEVTNSGINGENSNEADGEGADESDRSSKAEMGTGLSGEHSARNVGGDNSTASSSSGVAGTQEFVIPSEDDTSFFGIDVKAEDVAFVVDVSPSMWVLTENSGLTRRDCLRDELLRSVSALSKTQKFTVVFFNGYPHIFKEFEQVSNEASTVRGLEKRLNRPFPGEGTEPVAAVRKVLSDQYDVVFLLSDGEFDLSAVDMIQRANRGKTKICTISLGIDSETLKQIAADSGGEYRWVK